MKCLVTFCSHFERHGFCRILQKLSTKEDTIKLNDSTIISFLIYKSSQEVKTINPNYVYIILFYCLLHIVAFVEEHNHH
jgi:hypothetical protein